MRTREPLTALIDLVLPSDCAGCGHPEHPWCRRCAAALGGPTSPSVPGGPVVLAAGRYGGPLRTALLRYKERGRRDLARPLAVVLAGVLATIAPPGPAPVWLLPVPSRRAAARARGGDHVLRLCRALSVHRSDVRVAHPMVLDRRALDSVGLDATERAGNLRGRIAVRRGRLPPPGAPVVIVDDVLTTGATLRECHSALAAVGVVVPAAVVLCDATGQT